MSSLMYKYLLNWELLCRVQSSNYSEGFKCSPGDILIPIKKLNLLLSKYSRASRTYSFYLYRRICKEKIGLITSETNLPVGRFTNDSHGRAGFIRDSKESQDYYFSVFILLQRYFISRNKLAKNLYSKRRIVRLSQSNYWEARKLVGPPEGSGYEIKTVRNVLVTGKNSVIDQNYSYMCEAELGPTNWQADIYGNNTSNVVVSKNETFKKMKNIEGTAIYLSSRKDRFYYHALIWTLLKYLLIPRDMQPEVIILNKDLNFTIRNYILKRMKIEFPNSSIVYIDEDSVYPVDSLTIVMLNTSNQIYKFFVDFCETFSRSLLEESCQFSQDQVISPEKKLVVICRRSKMVILNRPSIEGWGSLIEELSIDFEPLLIDPGEHSLEEQARFFSQADYVIAEHGGALANIVFMKKQSNVIELQLTLEIDLYKNLAKACSVKYDCIKVPSGATGFELNSKQILDMIYRAQ